MGYESGMNDPSNPTISRRQTKGRTMACPSCGESFETMRRFQMACPKCGHEWDERSVLGIGDYFTRFRSEFGMRLFMVGGLIGAGFILYVILWQVFELFERGATENGIYLVLMIGGLVVFAYLVGRSRNY